VGKPVVLIAEELSPATLEALGPDFEVRNCDGADRGELLAALAKGVDAVLIVLQLRWMLKRLRLQRV
jgi:D-3-phosphoglycerate dehydrogenase / 2-oxoglutarate reductase